MYTIGELSKMKNVTVKALRFYEKIDLFKPAFIDPNNQYRYYTKEQLPILDIIKSARSLEISPKALVPIINSKNTSLVFSQLEKQKSMLQEQISRFEFMIDQIEAIEDTYKDSEYSIQEKGIYEKHIDIRYIISLDVPEPISIDALDACYNNIEKKISERDYINFYHYGLLLKHNKKGVYPDKAFIEVSNPLKFPTTDKIDTIESGRYICINYTSKNGAKKQKALTKYLEKNNLTPKKLIQVELVSDFFDTSDDVFELQLLIE